jgi:hypothetical protein
LEEEYVVSQEDLGSLRGAKEFNDAFEAKAKQDLDGFHVRLETFGH